MTATWHSATPPTVPLYWRAAPSAVGGGLLIGGFVHDQHRVPVIEVTGRPGRRDVQHLLVVPDRAGQQVLQPVRPAMPGRLGDRPAVVVFQFHQQAADHLAAGLPGLPPGKAPGHPSQQIRQQRGPGIISYRGSSDCRVLIVSHKPIMIAAAAPLRGPLTCTNNPTVTNYCCRIHAPRTPRWAEAPPHRHPSVNGEPDA